MFIVVTLCNKHSLSMLPPSLFLNLYFLYEQALIDICLKVSKAVRSGQASAKGSVSAAGKGWKAQKEKPFVSMNNIVANLLLNLTG